MPVFSARDGQLTVFFLTQSSGIETLVEELCCRLKDLQSEQGEHAGEATTALSIECIARLAFLITLSSARGFSEVLSGHMGNLCSQGRAVIHMCPSQTWRNLCLHWVFWVGQLAKFIQSFGFLSALQNLRKRLHLDLGPCSCPCQGHCAAYIHFWSLLLRAELVFKLRQYLGLR